MVEPDDPKSPVRWAYMLRIIGRNPEKFPMERIGAYISEFADLLGAENAPTFAGIKRASTGLKAKIPEGRRHYVHLRLVQARTEPASKPAKQLARIQQMIDVDSVRQAQILDSAQNVIYLFQGKTMQTAQAPAIYQTGSVDGVVVGVVGADDTMHLYLRDYLNRDIRILVRDEAMARRLLRHFRQDTIRVYVHGLWKRTDFGWIPETSKCTADSFEVLEDTPLSEVLAQFAAAPDNGWKTMNDPNGFLSDLRGEE